jgi:hypothetical protein
MYLKNISLLLLIGFFWFAGSRIQQQVSELCETLPAAIANVKQQMGQVLSGKMYCRKLLRAAVLKSSSGSPIVFSKLLWCIRRFICCVVLGDLFYRIAQTVC